MLRVVQCMSLLCVLLCGLVGCSAGQPYVLQGKVIEGGFTDLSFVLPDEPELDEPGISGAKIIVIRDGDRPNAHQVAEGRARSDGTFRIPIREFGTGWMIERWLIQAYKPGYVTAEALLTLPSADSTEQLLVTMSSGNATPPTSLDELWDQYEQFR
jgi:hypothetical protein